MTYNDNEQLTILLDEIRARFKDGAKRYVLDSRDLLEIMGSKSRVEFLNGWAEICIKNGWAYKFLGRSIMIEKDTADYSYG